MVGGVPGDELFGGGVAEIGNEIGIEELGD